MAERLEVQKFVEGVLGRNWDNFAQRVAGVYYCNTILHEDKKDTKNPVWEKLRRFISEEDLEKIKNAYRK